MADPDASLALRGPDVCGLLVDSVNLAVGPAFARGHDGDVRGVYVDARKSGGIARPERRRRHGRAGRYGNCDAMLIGCMRVLDVQRQREQVAPLRAAQGATDGH